MQYIKGLKDYHDDSQTAVTLGKFDGVHRGHEKLVEKVIEYADTAGVKSVVCAFDMLAFSKKHVDERCIFDDQRGKGRQTSRPGGLSGRLSIYQRVQSGEG